MVFIPPWIKTVIIWIILLVLCAKVYLVFEKDIKRFIAWLQRNKKGGKQDTGR